MPGVRLPRWIAVPLLRIASAGYFIYVSHVVAVHVLRHMLSVSSDPIISIPALLVTSVVAGLAFERAWLAGFAKVSRLVRR